MARNYQYLHRNPNDLSDDRKFKYPCSPKYAAEINVNRWTDVGAICPDCDIKDPVRYVDGDECSNCIRNSFEDQYKELNLDTTRYTLHRKLCPRGPHLKLTMTGGKKCINCETNSLSPRQQAIQAGEQWYMPRYVCPKCNTQSLKAVNDGRCQGCQPPKGPDLRKVDHDAVIPPGTVIDRETAKAIGLNIYRTGRPCKRGHNTVRWVKGGACIGCRK